jgi:DNA end-binding protein Ku
MFYTDEIRFENEFHANVEGVGAKELELAKTLLEAIEAPFAPEEFKDVYREELQAMIAKKMFEVGTAPAAQTAATTPPVVDILEALKKSIVAGPQVACTGDSAGTEDRRTRDGDQKTVAQSPGWFRRLFA